MDSSAKRGQASVTQVDEVFGVGTVRATRLHAKFATITNEAWSVLVTSSMNLNLNPRCEHFEMTDDLVRAGMFLGFVNEVFKELPPGDTEDRRLPDLHNMAAVEPVRSIHCAPMGAVSTGVFRDAG